MRDLAEAETPGGCCTSGLAVSLAGQGTASERWARLTTRSSGSIVGFSFETNPTRDPGE